MLARPSFLGICALALVFLIGSPARHALAEDDVVIHVPEDMGMEEFLTTVAKTTGTSLVWNPIDRTIRDKRLKGGIDLRAPQEEMFDLVRGLLAFYDLAIIPVGPGGHEIHLVMDARQTSSILKLKPVTVTLTEDNLARYAHADGLFITTSIQVEHMRDLRSARNALARIVTGQNIGNVTEVPDTKTFVVTDFAPNVVTVYRLLKRMDQPRPEASTTFGRTVAVAPAHARATTLALVLAQHFAPRVPAARPSRAPQISERPSSVPRITADARTNRILITGTEAEVKQVQAAIALLDIAVPTAAVPARQAKAPTVSAHVIRLSHAQAAQTARALTQLIRSSPALSAGGATRPTVVPHDETNALLVSASDADLIWIRAILRDLDDTAK